MLRTRSKKNVDPPPQNETIPVFEDLISAAAKDGLKQPLLEKFYSLLSTHPWSCSDLDELEFQIVPSGIRLTSKDMCRLSEILFEGLGHNFKQLLSALRVGCASRAYRQPVSHPDMLVSAAELNLLLRCCLKMLVVNHRQRIIDDNEQILLVIVRTLVQLASKGETGISLEHSYSSNIDHGNNSSSRYSTKEFVASMSSLKLTDSRIPILSSIIEGARGHNKSSLVVAAKFQKMQAMFLSKDPPANHKATEGQLESCSLSCDPGNMDADNTVEETCNVVNFLRCKGVKSSDLNDLADFIECKQGKNYHAYLKVIDKYRKYRAGKQAALWWKKKKQL